MVFTVICYPYHDNTEGSVPHIMITPTYLLRNIEVFHLFVPGHIPGQGLCTYTVPQWKHVWLEWLDWKKITPQTQGTQPVFCCLGRDLMAAQEKAEKFIKEICSFLEGTLYSCATGLWHRSLFPPTFPNPSLSCIHTSLNTWQIFVFSCHEHKFQVRDTCEGLMVGLWWVYIHQLLKSITV